MAVFDRVRSLPIPRSSPLIGAVLGDSVRYLVGASVIVGLGVTSATGRRPGLPGILATVALLVVFACLPSWLEALVGSRERLDHVRPLRPPDAG